MYVIFCQMVIDVVKVHPSIKRVWVVDFACDFRLQFLALFCVCSRGPGGKSSKSCNPDLSGLIKITRDDREAKPNVLGQKSLGSVLGRTDFSCIFFSRRIFQPILSPDFLSSFLGNKCPEKSSRKINPLKCLPQKSPTHFCRGAGPKSKSQNEALRIFRIFVPNLSAKNAPNFPRTFRALSRSGFSIPHSWYGAQTPLKPRKHEKNYTKKTTKKLPNSPPRVGPRKYKKNTKTRKWPKNERSRIFLYFIFSGTRPGVESFVIFWYFIVFLVFPGLRGFWTLYQECGIATQGTPG